MSSTNETKELGDIAVGGSSVDEQVKTVQPTESANAAVPEEFLHLFEHDDNERIIAQALRHPFGVYFIYATVAVVVIIVMAVLGTLASNPKEIIGTQLSGSAVSMMVFAGFTLVSLAVIGGMLAAYVYKKSRLILTNQKIVIIRYNSLFSREVSQLNIVETEDINVSQPTLIDRIVKTGTITIETAGEQDNYVLSWTKDPFEFARLAVQVREAAGAGSRSIRK